jgi:hypothetical protein
LLAWASVLLLASCFSVGRDFSVQPVRSIQNNVTTQREIFTSFGEPLRRGLENGLESWTYSYQYYQLGQLRDVKELHVVFNDDRTVRAYSFTAR